MGGGWAIVFARAGEQVRVYDAAPAICDGFMAVIGQQLDDLKRYDLVDDPWELTNVAQEALHAGVLAEMRLRLADWSIDTEDARPVPMPDSPGPVSRG